MGWLTIGQQRRDGGCHHRTAARRHR
jgi:hypothetical protein